MLSWMKTALSETGKSLMGSLQGVMPGQPADTLTLDNDRLDAIEEALIRADVGVETAIHLTAALRREKARLTTRKAVLACLADEFNTLLKTGGSAPGLTVKPGMMTIALLVGVNGAGKTTLLGKLAHRFTRAGQRVVIGAGDTFRAAAVEQLAVWAERAGATFVGERGGSGDSDKPARDPASVMYEAIETAKNSGAGVVLLDTAGRLQNKHNLMEELRKIRTVIDKVRPADSVLEVLLVLDATTGQNALQQARVFRDAVDLTGVALTKLDGSAKGGVVLAIAREFQLPVRLVGVGEGIEDLRDFDAGEFVAALFDGAESLKGEASHV
ncbi:MAG: signal recognition particle-docking protein FtsY [Candidatus Melainabacteria bacterium]